MSPTTSPRLTKSTTDTHFSTPELDLFLQNISGLLEKFTEQLPTVSTPECAGTSGETLSKSELNEVLTDVNEFLEKSTAALPSILAAEFANPAQADSRRTNHKLFLDNVDDLLGKFTDLLANVASTQHDDQSGEKLSLPALQRLLSGIKNLHAKFNNLLPLVKSDQNNPWRFGILDKLNALANKIGNLIPQFTLPKPGHIAISMPNGIGGGNSTTPPHKKRDVVIPIDELASRKTNPAALSTSQFSHGIQSEKPVLGDLSSESSAINGQPLRPGITPENIQQITIGLREKGYTQEQIDEHLNSLFIKDYIYSLLEASHIQTKTEITPQQFDELVTAVKSFRKDNWPEQQIKTWIHIKVEGFQKNAGLPIADRNQLTTSSSNQGNYSAHGNLYTFFRPVRKQRMPEDTLELQEIVTSKP